MISGRTSVSSRRCHPIRVAALASVMLAGAASGADTTPPQLKAVAFTPAVIDTSSSPAEVLLGLAVADDESGANYIEAVFIDPSGVFRQSASGKFAPTQSGTLQTKVVFPRFSAAGIWTLANVFLSDAAGNTLILDAEGLSRLGFNTRLEVKSAQDTTSPKLTSLQFDPPKIDTTLGAADVNLKFTATDDLSGVSFLELVFASPSGAYEHLGPVKWDPQRSVSGSKAVSFPRRSEAGRWTLKNVLVSDAAGNTQLLDTDALSAMQIATSLEVISRPDLDPPRIEILKLATESIDTTDAGAVVEVQFRATDADSGIQQVEAVFQSPSGAGQQHASAAFPALNGISDSLKVTFPRFSEAGEWSLSGFSVVDAAGNTAILGVEELAGAGVRTKLQVKSARSTAPPELAGLEFTPKVIDTRRGAAAIQVGFRATDPNGVKSVEVVFVSPSGSVRQHASVELPSKSEAIGAIKVEFPQSSEPGPWNMESLMVSDQAGNTLVLNAEALSSKVQALQVR